MTSKMESIEQTSSNPKRKLGNVDDGEHFYSFDIEHEQSTKSFRCHSPTLTVNSNSNSNTNNNTLTNYQQTTKIIQEFNIQQLTTSDITVSSTINIKSTPKQQMKISNNDLLSEADFQRVVQDITPADRDLFDEFLNTIKQKTDDYLFLSSFDDLPSSSSASSSQEQDNISKRHSSLSLPTQTSSTISTDRRRNSITRGSSTIHYSPHSMPVTNRPTPPVAAAQTLKQMAVQHQQRIMYNQQQQQQQQQQLTSSYPNYPYNNNNNNNNSTRQYYQQTQISSDNDTNINSTSYYQPMCYSPVQQIAMSGYNHHSQQHSNIYGIQNYSYQTSSSFYQQPPPQPQQQPQQISTSSYSVANYSPSNGLLSTATTLPSSTFYSQEDNLPIIDL
ncbi:unnamed protein product [Rotaria sp. Silwood1]|nr:unnamed protein product [Rotaria sp. Silwood1]CAF1403971.1 unnamed protein product [Rotaria sp. Silwood1]CAF3612132.1 unnamed protein product [Rotaria sp. Silwood1]CAF4601187.1 unnamed protein product [Rotaria sp. Silwood1]